VKRTVVRSTSAERRQQHSKLIYPPQLFMETLSRIIFADQRISVLYTVKNITERKTIFPDIPKYRLTRTSSIEASIPNPARHSIHEASMIQVCRSTQPRPKFPPRTTARVPITTTKPRLTQQTEGSHPKNIDRTRPSRHWKEAPASIQ
jgi:hypothetical protein